MQASYALGYNLAIEYLADYEKTWMLDSFRALDARVLAPQGRRLREWLFLEVRVCATSHSERCSYVLRHVLWLGSFVRGACCCRLCAHSICEHAAQQARHFSVERVFPPVSCATWCAFISLRAACTYVALSEGFLLDMHCMRRATQSMRRWNMQRWRACAGRGTHANCGDAECDHD